MISKNPKGKAPPGFPSTGPRNPLSWGRTRQVPKGTLLWGVWFRRSLRRHTQSCEVIRSLAKFICNSLAALGPEFESISSRTVRFPLHADNPTRKLIVSLAPKRPKERRRLGGLAA